MLTEIQLLQVKNEVNRILHVPGNYTGGILEMAIVADYHMPQQELEEDSKRILDTLKKQNELFCNVRLNLLKWVSDDCILKEVTPIPYVQMGRAYKDYGQKVSSPDKSLDELLRQLKLFYARSKVILILTDGSYRIAEKKSVQEYLQPFLLRKLLLLQNGEPVQGTALFLKTMKENAQGEGQDERDRSSSF